MSGVVAQVDIPATLLDLVALPFDGMDGASFGTHPVGLASLLAAAEQFRTLPIEELVERLSSDLFTQTRQSDDLTVFGVEMMAGDGPR